ncbi:MAG: 4-hydroxythreonine-4-phosphate dehydrogenase PdxA [Candidatus Omnitrophica bacterium]|nr:4-hydroxythreonine-4-phosphate dehydrogenase PdxA [Candidatus Omnitrophota bacterium]
MPTSPSAKSRGPAVVAITLGDPGGIGPEVTLKALRRVRSPRTAYLLLGPAAIYEALSRRLKAPARFRELPYYQRDLLRPGGLYLLNPSPDSKKEPVRMGKVCLANARLAWASLKVGAHLAACGLVDALVTAPVNKEAMRLTEGGFVGHTEYLAGVSKSRRVAMMFDGGRLKVTLATIHVPLKEVSGRLRAADLAVKIALTDDFLRRFYRIRAPRIAVAALNPHGREFGTEEDRIIVPAIRRARRQGIAAAGPFPGDEVFHAAYHGRHDAVIAMYHDQGLAPLKTLAFDQAVNITLGLPFIRTSPDHGTAFDIAGRNQADESSMAAALEKARQFLLPSGK